MRVTAARLALPVPLVLLERQALPVRLAPQVRLELLAPQELRAPPPAVS